MKTHCVLTTMGLLHVHVFLALVEMASTVRISTNVKRAVTIAMGTHPARTRPGHSYVRAFLAFSATV